MTKLRLNYEMSHVAIIHRQSQLQVDDIHQKNASIPNVAQLMAWRCEGSTKVI